MIEALEYKARAKGVPKHKVGEWINRCYGQFVIHRETHEGIGTSFPCILCRKRLESLNIRWTAYLGSRWIESCEPNIPDSIFTSRQHRTIRGSCKPIEIKS